MNKQRVTDVVVLLLRVVSGLVFFQAGAAKMFGWFGGMPGGGTVPLLSQIGIGGTMEIVIGILMMLGLFVRPAAFLASGEMAVAYWQFHAPQSRWPIQNQGVGAVLLCFIFLLFAVTGGGAYALDSMRGRRGKR